MKEEIIIKTSFDFLVSMILITCLFPIMILLSLVILFIDKGSPIFTQQRVGKNNRTFKIYKFKTMKKDTPQLETNLIDESLYTTNLGRFLRNTSLDELPQLLNIIKGDMSLVGPRPALYNQYDLIHKRTELNIHSIKPGLTGLAQISGRDSISDDEKVIYDLYYLNNKTIRLDLYIIVKTIFEIYKKEK